MPDHVIWKTSHPDEEKVKAAVDSVPHGIWILASIEHDRLVSARPGADYPHVCKRGGGTRWYKGCAPCMAALAADEQGEPARSQVGNGGHACGPAAQGHGLGHDAWTCPGCGAGWVVEVTAPFKVPVRTWYRT